MATEKILNVDTAPAGADLSTKQYYLVKFTADTAVVGTAGAVSFPLQNKPKQGQSAEYVPAGKAKVIYGGTVHIGDPLASDGTGKAVATTAGSGAAIVGYASVAGTSGDIGSMNVAPSLNASTS